MPFPVSGRAGSPDLPNALAGADDAFVPDATRLRSQSASPARTHRPAVLGAAAVLPALHGQRRETANPVPSHPLIQQLIAVAAPARFDDDALGGVRAELAFTRPDDLRQLLRDPSLSALDLTRTDHEGQLLRSFKAMVHYQLARLGPEASRYDHACASFAAHVVPWRKGEAGSLVVQYAPDFEKAYAVARTIGEDAAIPPRQRAATYQALIGRGDGRMRTRVMFGIIAYVTSNDPLQRQEIRNLMLGLDPDELTQAAHRLQAESADNITAHELADSLLQGLAAPAQQTAPAMANGESDGLLHTISAGDHALVARRAFAAIVTDRTRSSAIKARAGLAFGLRPDVPEPERAEALFLSAMQTENRAARMLAYDALRHLSSDQVRLHCSARVNDPNVSLQEVAVIQDYLGLLAIDALRTTPVFDLPPTYEAATTPPA